jgi:hypothetical protein
VSLLRVIGDYILIFIGFGLVMYFLLPLLMKRQLSAESRLRKTIWGAALFTAAKFIVDVAFP